jgi:hypothetical protein
VPVPSREKGYTLKSSADLGEKARIQAIRLFRGPPILWEAAKKRKNQQKRAAVAVASADLWAKPQIYRRATEGCPRLLQSSKRSNVDRQVREEFKIEQSRKTCERKIRNQKIKSKIENPKQKVEKREQLTRTRQTQNPRGILEKTAKF